MRLFDMREAEGVYLFKSCIDKVHALWGYVPYEDDEAEFEVEGPCDGSCAPAMVAMNGLLSEEIDMIDMGDGTEMPTRVIVDVAFKALFDQGDVVGELVCDLYAKRSLSSQLYKLADGRYVVAATSLDYLACSETGFFETCTVTLFEKMPLSWELPVPRDELIRLWRCTPDHSEG